MPTIVFSEDQALTAAAAQKAVPVYDAKGNVLGLFEPFRLTTEEIAELKRQAASPGPCYTGAQVQARLRALQDEWDRTGSFDAGYAREYVERLNAADPGHESTDQSKRRVAVVSVKVVP